MKYLVATIIAVFFCINLSAQKADAGKTAILILQKKLKSGRDAPPQVDILNKIGRQYLYFNEDSSLYYGQKALGISQAIDYPNGIAEAYLLLTKAHYQKSEFSKAFSAVYSAQAAFRSLENETGKALCDYEIGRIHFGLKNTDSTFYYIENAIPKLDPEEYYATIANAKFVLALSHWREGDYAEGLSSIDETIEAYEQHNDSMDLPAALNSLGAMHWGLANYSSALESFFDALIISEKIGFNEDKKIIYYNNIGMVYFDWENKTKALEYFQMAERLIPTSTDKVGIAYTYLNLGTYYLEMGKISKAQGLLEKSKEKYAEINDRNGVCLCELKIGQCLQENQDFDSAKEKYLRALEIAGLTGHKHRQALSFYHLSLNETGRSNLPQALDYAQSSLDIAEKGQYKDLLNLLYQNLSEIYEGLGQFPLSLEMLKKSMAYKDEINKEKVAVQYEIMQLSHKNTQREYENQQLKVQNDLRGSTILYGGIVVVLILLLLVGTSIYFLSVSKRNKQLRLANQTKDKIFSVVAHDLRGPIGNLNSMIELMTIENVDIDYNKTLNLFKPIVANLYNMLENLLMWARANLGKIEIQKQAIQLNAAINETIAILANESEQKSVVIEFSPVSDFTVFADPDLLQIVIRNLLNNAIKFSYENGKVEILTQVINKLAVVTIIDHGVGISEENQKKMFAGKLQNQGTQKEKGSGLGLVLCKELVEKNHGTLWVESSEGNGSEFSFSIPMGK